MGQTIRAAAGFETALTEHRTCLFCDTNSTVEEELVQCYDCGLWAHKKCAGLTELEYSILAGANDTIQWVCRQCLAGNVEQRRWIEAHLDELTEQVKYLTERVGILEQSHTIDTLATETEEEEADKNAVTTVSEKFVIKDESLTASDMTESRGTYTVGREREEEEKVTEPVERMNSAREEEQAEKSVEEERITESVIRLAVREEPALKSVTEETITESVERTSTVGTKDPAKRSVEEEDTIELVERRNLVLKEEPVEKSDDQGETRDSGYAEMKWGGDRQPSEASSDGEPPAPAFLRYSREELHQIAPAPLTPELTLRLLYLGLSADFPKRVYRYESTAHLFRLKYSRAELLQLTPAPPAPELISHLLSLGICANPSRKRRQHKDTGIKKCEAELLLYTSTEGPCKGKQPPAMPSPQSGVSGWGGGTDGSFACLLCEAGGFTAQGMERHVQLCHGNQGEEEGQGPSTPFSCPMCPFSTACHSECQAHVNTQHPELPMTLCDMSSHGRRVGSQQSEAGTSSSSDVDGVDGDGCVLETSLRLNDGPDEEEGEGMGDVSEDMNDNDDDDCLAAEVNAKRETGGGGAPEELSNLSVILCSEQNQDEDAPMPEVDPAEHPDPQNTAQRHHHGGARPKVKPPQPADGSMWLETSPDQQALSSSAEGEDRGRERKFVCPLCSFGTDSELEIENHVSQQHLREEEEGGEEGGTKQDVSCMRACPFCGSKFDMLSDLSVHVNTYHPDWSDAGGGRGWENLPDPAAATSSSVTWGGGRVDSGQQCPVCGVQCSEASLADHVNQHFTAPPSSSASSTSTDAAVIGQDADEDFQVALQLQREEEKKQQEENSKFKTVQTRYGMDSTMTAKQQFDQDLDRAVFKGQITASEFHEKKIARAQSQHSGIDDGSTRVAGIVERLQQFYASKNCPRNVKRAHLCSSLHHYSASFGDKGWGCGYRNLQMMLSCLVNDPTYLHMLFNGKAKIPSIQKLQQLIEAAWQKGFDPQGCRQLGGAVVNTRKWIGATEVVSMLSSQRVKCRLVDFVKPSGPNSTHPVMLQWVRDYFTSPAPFKPPLYLQHQGHSRTIIGVEELVDGGTNLLLFDPGVAQTRMEQFCHSAIDYRLMQTLRKTLNAFHARQYQVLAVVGVLSDKEFEKSKIIQSERKG